MVEQLYWFDQAPEERKPWVASATVMVICFDERSAHSADGRVYSFYCPPKDFYGLDGLLVCMDAVMDEIGSPQRWNELRTTASHRKRRKPEATRVLTTSGRKKPIISPSSLNRIRGQMCTVSVWVYSRQFASMQGEVMVPGGKAIGFRSALELLYLLRETLAASPVPVET